MKAPALSLATVDPDIQQGDQVTVVWGEPDGGTAKPTVERRKQIEVRATVGPSPFPRTPAPVTPKAGAPAPEHRA